MGMRRGIRLKRYLAGCDPGSPQRQAETRYRARKLLAGTCIFGGCKAPVEPEHVRCATHRAKYADAEAKR